MNNWYPITSLIASIFSLLLGIFVYLKGKNNPVNKSFAFINFSLVVWCFGSYNVNIARDQSTALFWDRFIYIGAVFIPVFFAHFVFLNL